MTATKFTAMDIDVFEILTGRVDADLECEIFIPAAPRPAPKRPVLI